MISPEMSNVSIVQGVPVKLVLVRAAIQAIHISMTGSPCTGLVSDGHAECRDHRGGRRLLARDMVRFPANL